MSQTAYLWLGIALLALSTVLTRSGMLLIGERLRLPVRFSAALRYAPACALTAIIVPDLMFASGQLQLQLDNFRLMAGIVAVGVFAASRSTIGTIAGGMIAFWVLRAWFI